VYSIGIVKHFANKVYISEHERQVEEKVERFWKKVFYIITRQTVVKACKRCQKKYKYRKTEK
jgi:hypothetical protein